jgi:hypothetical protein
MSMKHFTDTLGNELMTLWLVGTPQIQFKIIITRANYLSVGLTEIFLTQLHFAVTA